MTFAILYLLGCAMIVILAVYTGDMSIITDASFVWRLDVVRCK